MNIELTPNQNEYLIDVLISIVETHYTFEELLDRDEYIDASELMEYNALIHNLIFLPTKTLNKSHLSLLSVGYLEGFYEVILDDFYSPPNTYNNDIFELFIKLGYPSRPELRKVN